MKVAFHEAARAEFDEAVRQYRTISQNLADDFRDKSQRAISLIVERPNAWHRLAGGVRRLRLHRFPYGIVYRVRGETIEIYAVMHLKRRPGYWRDRSKSKS